MDLPLTIDLTAFDMIHQKNIEQERNRVVLHPDKIEIELDMLADEPPVNEDGEPDKHLPWEQCRTYFYATLKRSSLIGVDLMYLKVTKLYKVTIVVPAAEPRFYFKTRSKARIFLDTLKEYIFQNETG